jgi:TolB protein
MPSPTISHILIRRSCALFLSLTLGATGGWLQADNAIRLPDVVAASSITVRTVEITSSDAAWTPRLRFLFGLHGGFRIDPRARTEFVFAFEPQGTGCLLTISSAGQTLLREMVTGRSATDAVLRAADLAVRRTLGSPGFFGGQLAFVSTRSGQSEIYTSDLLFSNTRQLTADRGLVLLPAFAPNGTRLLYTGYHRTGFPDIYQVDLASGRRTTFASFKGMNTGAVFSADGNRIAMVLTGPGNAEIFVADARGQNLQRLTRTPAIESDPSFSPDGRRLVFTSDSMGKPQIFTMDVDGANYQRVPTNISRVCSEPVWNPRDPDLIAFTAASGRSFQLALYSFTNRQSRMLTSAAGDAVHPVWLNDGRHLIYTSRNAAVRRLMVLDTHSGRAVPLSPAEFGDCEQADFIYP